MSGTGGVAHCLSVGKGESEMSTSTSAVRLLGQVIDFIEQMIAFARAVVKVLRTLEDCFA